MARPASDIRERIVLGARARFAEQGVDATSLREIARDARTSLGMIYYYFGTKERLFLAVLDDVYDGLMEDLRGLLAGSDDVESRLRGLYARIARMSDDEALTLQLVVREAMSSPARRRSLVKRFAGGHVPLLATSLSAAVGRGELRVDRDPVAMLMAVAGLAFFPQLVRRLAAPDLPAGWPLPPAERLAAELVEIVMNGIAARRSG